MECNHEDNRVSLGFEVFDCKRGQSMKSLETWGKRWRVDISTVRRFFRLCEKDSMIVRENLQKTTRITVCNYDFYNDFQQLKQSRSNGKANATQFASNSDAIQTKNDLKNDLKNEEGVVVPQPDPDLKKEYRELETALTGKDTKEVWTSVTGFIRDKSPEFLEPYAAAWNIFATTYKLPALKMISDSRRKKFATRIREPGFDFLKILEAIKVSPHLKGDNNRGWKTDFNWILENDSNYLKILEGNYN